MLLEQRMNDAHHLGMTMIIEPILLENRLLILVNKDFQHRLLIDV